MGSDSVKLRHYSFLGIVNVTCPLDIYKCPFVHWTNRNVHWTYINVHSSIGRTEMSIGHSNVHLSIGQTEMSIGHSNVHSSIGRTEMSIGHPNVHSSIGRMDEWTLSNGKHSSLLSTWGQTQSNYVITASLALKTLHAHWTYINVHSSIGRAEMSIEWTLSNGKHSSLLSTWGQTQLNYVITASLAL